MNLNLNCEGFEQNFSMKKSIYGGIQYIFRFENGYGASVVKHTGSYGSYEDLWEFAVLKYETDVSWNLCYETEITDDVLGYLTENEVRDLLRKIRDLPFQND